MSEEQIFGVVASLSLLIWLLGRGIVPDPRRRRQAELIALGLVGAGIVYALFQTVLWFAR
jgi:hypothetical protein